MTRAGGAKSELTILSVAYPMARVGLDAVGGAEQILAALDAAIVAAGHRLIVIAPEGSRTSGTLVPVPFEGGVLDAAAVGRAHAAVIATLPTVLARERVDVIHMHGIDFDRYVPPPGPPMLVTLHLPPSWYSREALTPSRPRTHLCCVSRSQHATLPAWAAPAEVIENGVRTTAFRPRPRKRDFCLMLARICPEKGVHEALDAAEEAGVPLLIGGDVSPWETHQRYFQDVIRKRLRRPHRWLGPVGFERKRRLLAAARALLVPSRAPETSSLVAMEALASGTPVIAYASGALPDIVEHRTTGFVVHDVHGMAEAIPTAHEISPDACRRAAVTRFSAEVMTSRYLEQYERLAGATAAPRGSRPADLALTTEEVHGLDALVALAPEWARLWDRCPAASPFQRPEWLVAYARAFCGPGRDAEPWALVVRSAGELVALAPLCTRSGSSAPLVIALSLPLTVSTGAPFPGRDLILFLTFAIIFVTLVVQGLSLKAVIRALGLKPDPESAREMSAARARLAVVGLEALDACAAEQPGAEDAKKALRLKYQHVAHRYQARLVNKRITRDEERIEAYRTMRLKMLGAERAALIAMRDKNEIADDVLREIQHDLDLEQVLLEQPGPSDGGFDSAPEIRRETRE